MPELTPDQIESLVNRFTDLINYEGDDPLAPINPLTYRDSDGDSLLHIATRRADAEAVSLLLSAGVDPNIRGDMGYAPLHYAADNRDSEIAKLLISRGANTKALNEFGKAPDLAGF